MADHFKRALLLRGGILFQERITSVNTGAPRESSRVPETLGIPINEPSKSEKRKEMGREGWEGGMGGKGRGGEKPLALVEFEFETRTEQRWFRNGRVNYIPGSGMEQRDAMRYANKRFNYSTRRAGESGRFYSIP